MASKSKNVQLKKADIDFYRMSGVFAIACVFIFYVLKMSSTMTNYHSTGKNLTYNFYQLCRNPIFIIFAVAVALAAAVWFAICKIKGKNESMKLFRSSDAIVLVGYFAVFTLCFGVHVNSLNHTFFIAFTIIASILYYISRLYKADFTFYSCLNAFFAFAIFFIADKAGTTYTIVKIALVVLSAIAIFVFWNKNKSHFKNSKHNKMLFCIPSYVSLIIFAVFLFLRVYTYQSVHALTVNAMLVILLVQYLIAGIVYTIRLIRE